jgi:hypothetical protein
VKYQLEWAIQNKHNPNGQINTIWCFSCLFWLSSVRVLLPMLPVSLDCPFLIAPSIYSNNYLFICFIGVAMSVLIVISWTFPLVRSSIILLLPLFISPVKVLSVTEERTKYMTWQLLVSSSKTYPFGIYWNICHRTITNQFQY